MWDEMHEHLGNGGGMGSYMGQGMNEDMRTDMQQEIQEHTAVALAREGVKVLPHEIVEKNKKGREQRERWQSKKAEGGDNRGIGFTSHRTLYN